jgi:hypothetical protein
MREASSEEFVGEIWFGEFVCKLWDLLNVLKRTVVG